MKLMHAAGLAVVTVLLSGSLAACEKEKPRGACEVDYELGAKGEACTEAREDECTDNVQPSISMAASVKKKTFTAGKTCGDVGYKTTGCSNIPIAWSFKGKCP